MNTKSSDGGYLIPDYTEESESWLRRLLRRLGLYRRPPKRVPLGAAVIDALKGGDL